jgi:hypothetical protein
VIIAIFLETYGVYETGNKLAEQFQTTWQVRNGKAIWNYMMNESQIISSEPTYSGKRVNHCCIMVGRRFLTLEAENVEVSFDNSNFLKQSESLAQ